MNMAKLILETEEEIRLYNLASRLQSFAFDINVMYTNHFKWKVKDGKIVSLEEVLSYVHEKLEENNLREEDLS